MKHASKHASEHAPAGAALFQSSLHNFAGARRLSTRSIVLLAIISLHIALLIHLSADRRSMVIMPADQVVVMTQLIDTSRVAEPITPAAPPSVPKPPVANRKPVTPSPPMKSTARLPVKPIERVVTQSSLAAATPAARAEPVAPAPPTVVADAAAPLPPAPLQAVPAPAPVTVTAPRFNAAYLNNPPPAYPPMARRLGEEGKVMLRVYVTPEGTAGEVRLQASSGSSSFDEAAIAAVRQWRFVAARQGDEPVAAWVQVPIVFKLG